MTKHLSEARDRWAKEFKNRVARMEKILATDSDVVDQPTPLTQEELPDTQSPTADGKDLEQSIIGVVRDSIRMCDWCDGDMRDIGYATTGMASGIWKVWLCECGHEIEAPPKDYVHPMDLPAERNPLKGEE